MPPAGTSRVTSPGQPPVLVEQGSAGELTIGLNRPARKNAIDLETVQALRATLAGARASAVVLCSTSPGIFCAGADVKIDAGERAEVSRNLYALYREMLAAPVPIVAALDGAAVGGGAQLAVACDLRIASPRAWIQFVGPGHGLAVGAWALPSLVGRGRALDLCLSGRRVAATEAHQIGLVDRIEEDPLAASTALAAEWGGLDAGAVGAVKAIISLAAEREAALELEARGNRSWEGWTA
ncbi:MAG: enoyl-CoA hydratase/isomerase family protein [Acidobacteriota bacterium]|nr:enoyl-CoA hydratase/isomerase family protein [Acidobacteriota bacterium]